MPFLYGRVSCRGALAKGRRYVIRLAAGNGVGATVTQRFTLTVS